MGHWLRRRWWVVAGAFVVVVAAVITVVAVAGDEPDLGVLPLARVLDADVGVDSRVAFDAEAGDRDVAYFAYTVGELPQVAAYRPGTDQPLWTFRGDATVIRLHLAVAGDLLLLFSTCKLLCPKLVGLDRRDGKRLWTADLPAFRIDRRCGRARRAAAHRRAVPHRRGRRGPAHRGYHLADRGH